MIGCIGYTSVLECSQYVQDVYMMKGLYMIILLVVAIYLIYFSKTKNYLQLKKKYTSYNMMLKVPIWFSYIAVFFLIVGGPALLSVNITMAVFNTVLFTFYLPCIAWVLLMVYYFITEWVFMKLGFQGKGSFTKALFKK